MQDVKYAIGCKQVAYMKMKLGEYNEYRGWKIPENEDPNRPGYLVQYVDQDPVYESWSPAEVFEKFYFPLQAEDGSKLESEDIANFTWVESVETLPDQKSTLVKANTRTGFVQYDVSSCVDPKNYSIEIGKQVAVEKIQNRMWYAMGFVLQWARNGFVHEPGVQ